MTAAETVAGSKHFAAVEPEKSLLSRSFLGLLTTQLLGASNDNILRWLVIGLGKHVVDESRVSWILAIGTASFVLPYLLLAAPAGYLADRFSKRRVIVLCKAAELAIMALAIGAIWYGSVPMMLMVVAMMGAQSALFGPAKLGSIPEMLDQSRISAANGIIGLTTVIATTLGSGLGMWLADAVAGHVSERLWIAASALLGVAVAGLATSLFIRPLEAANPQRRFPWDAARQTWRDLQTLHSDPALWRVALGIMFFWSLGALAQLNIDQFAFEGEATRQTQVAPLLVSLVVGVGVGSVLAGVWSAGRVELGILPLGAGGLLLMSLSLFTVEGEFFEPSGDWTISYIAASALLFFLGCSAGLFDVPLAAYMQQYSPPQQRGSILAASNFLTFSGMLVVSLMFGLIRLPALEGSLDNALAVAGDDVERQQAARDLWDQMHADQKSTEARFRIEPYLAQRPQDELLVRHVYQETVGHPLLTARQIFLLCGMMTLPVLIYIVVLIPQATIRFMAWLVTHTVYRIGVFQRENLPETGGALLAPNHVSWLDGMLLVAVSPRPVRIMITGRLVNQWWSKALAGIMGAIPFGRSPKAARQAIATARQALENGELVCIFPEGGITRTGQLLPFRPGMMQILKGSNAPVIPVYLDELWGSIFSFRGGKFFWKWPSEGTRRVSIWFGQPVEQPTSVFQIRDAVQSLGADAVTGRKQRAMVLPRLMIRKCRKAQFRWKIADSTGQALTGGQLLMRSLILRRLLLREVFQPDEKYVGVLIPPSCGSVVVNCATTLAGRVACNLNYTLTSDVMNQCIRRAGIRHVLTSKKVMDRLDLQLDAEVVLLEDFK
ncbi:MAG: MFS transporter, partial [Planctomycetales bacterium]|nr:MFS transporter [Planctomycetales bacterium]